MQYKFYSAFANILTQTYQTSEIWKLS